jgi:hypothetical protein
LAKNPSTALHVAADDGTVEDVEGSEERGGTVTLVVVRQLKRGVFQSVVDLQLTINRFVADTNADPKPFVWTADPKRVLAAIKRGKQTLESIH